MSAGRIPSTANSPLTAKGDLFSFSTAPARLAVGSNGDTIVADSSTATGLRYSATPSASNPVLNSAFQVWQRGTSVSGAGGGAYTADRWFLYAGSNGVVSRQLTGDTTNLPNIQYCARVGRPVSTTDTTNLPFTQSFETVNSIPFAGKTITMSFYARKGANYSPTGSTLVASLATGTGTDQNYSSVGYTGGATPISQSPVLTTTWQRFSYTAAIDATTTEITPRFVMVPTGTAGAADYFEITGVQIDIGSVALPFRTYAATIQGELAACQRYYWRTTVNASNATTVMTGGLAVTTSALAQAYCAFPTAMRTSPSSSINNTNMILYNGAGGGYSVAVTTLASTNSSTIQGCLNLNTAGGLTVNVPFLVLVTGGGAGFIEFSAEL